MRRLVLWRLAQTPLVVLAVYTLTFVLAWALPGDLERVMPSFAGNIAFGRDCVRWRARDVA